MPKTKHGLSFTKVYKAWSDAKQRCYNTDHPEYCHYRALKINELNLAGYGYSNNHGK